MKKYLLVLLGVCGLGLVSSSEAVLPQANIYANITGTTVSVALSPLPTDANQNGAFYLAAFLPNATYFHNGASWVAVDPATSAPPSYAVGVLQSKNFSADVSALASAYLYVGYGKNYSDMLQGEKYGNAIQVKPMAQSIPNTGQTTVYAAGDNGTYSGINPMSYTDNGDGTIKDAVTGLMWQKQDNGTTVNWGGAIQYCAGLALGGYRDWRLPSSRDLQSIVNYGTFFPAITSSVFPNTQSASYFSSTPYAPAPSFAWLYPFYDATALWGYKSAPGYARCVRLGQQGNQSFTDNGNGTITDNVTGIVWQKQDDGIARDWKSAVDYCVNLSLSGYRGWRLPNVKELNSIADLSISNPAVNSAYFKATQSSFYWSSTSYAYSATNAWGVVFYDGSVYSNDKSFKGYTRCARPAQ